MIDHRLRRAAILATLALIATGCQQVGSGEQGVLFERFGGGTQEEFFGEGVHFVAPWNSMIVYSVRTQDREERLKLLTNNGLSVGMDISVRFKPQSENLSRLHQTLGPAYYDVVVKQSVRNEARAIVGQYAPEEIYSTKRDEVQSEIERRVRTQLQTRFIELENILIRNIELPERLQQAIAEKLEEEQRSERMQFTLERERREAERKSIEAKGIAEFQRIVSQGISDQLLQWKGIEATQQLAQSSNSKVIVIGSGKSGLPLILGGNN